MTNRLHWNAPVGHKLAQSSSRPAIHVGHCAGPISRGGLLSAALLEPADHQELAFILLPIDLGVLRIEVPSIGTQVVSAPPDLRPASATMERIVLRARARYAFIALSSSEAAMLAEVDMEHAVQQLPEHLNGIDASLAVGAWRLANWFSHVMPAASSPVRRLHRVNSNLIASRKHRDINILAAETNITRRQLHRDFTRSMNMPPSNFVRLVRLQHALHMLYEGVSLATASAEAGFSDQSHMARDVKALTGMRPSRFAAMRASAEGHVLLMSDRIVGVTPEFLDHCS